jgi:hypothetical protein
MKRTVRWLSYIFQTLIKLMPRVMRTQILIKLRLDGAPGYEILTSQRKVPAEDADVFIAPPRDVHDYHI